MLYILNWSIKTENRHKALDRFVSADLSQEQPDGFRIKGRYHSMGDFTGVVVFEADNELEIDESIFVDSNDKIQQSRQIVINGFVEDSIRVINWSIKEL